MLTLLQIIAIAAFAPFVQGSMKRLRANLQGRPGPSPFQPYRDLAKLFAKEALQPKGSSPLPLIAPGIVLGVALTFAAALPLVAAPGGLNPVVDIIALAFLLGLGRFVLALAALDTRSAFAGMAASREMTFSSLVEPTLLLALLGGAMLSGGTKLSMLLAAPFGLAATLAFAAFFLVLLAETARIPIDNQETHYELTMIHEGLVLEYSGWQLAMLQFAEQVRQLSFFVLAAVLLPGGAAWWMHLPWIVAFAAAIAVTETMFAKLRLFEVPQLLTTAFILAATSIILRALGMLA
ncbi:MAG: respiratory chain complex I subunit 1 family protein [Vulcanimicrobiaceae bacterium]